MLQTCALILRVILDAELFLNVTPHLTRKNIKTTLLYTQLNPKDCCNYKIVCLVCTVQNICIVEHLVHRLSASTCQDMLHGARRRNYTIRGARSFSIPELLQRHLKKFAGLVPTIQCLYLLGHRPYSMQKRSKLPRESPKY